MAAAAALSILVTAWSRAPSAASGSSADLEGGAAAFEEFFETHVDRLFRGIPLIAVLLLAQFASAGAQQRLVSGTTQDGIPRSIHPQRHDSVLAIALDAWLDRLKLDGVRTRDNVTHRFDVVDVTGDTAIVKLRLTINGRHVYTDYLGLYRSARGWQIVNKVFQGHD